MPTIDDTAARGDIETLLRDAYEYWGQEEYFRSIERVKKALEVSDKIPVSARTEKDLGKLCILITGHLASEKSLGEILVFSDQAVAARSIGKDENVVAAIYHNVANCFFSMQMFDKAIEYYDLALSLKHDHFQYDSSKIIFLGKMKALKELNRIDEAIGEMKKVYAISTSANDHLVLAQFYEIAGRPAEAVSEYETVLHLAPDNGLAYVRLKSLGKDPGGAGQTTVVTREIVRVPCPYCSSLVDNTFAKCPSCGAPQRR